MYWVNSKKGFLLVEVCIYMALFSFFLMSTAVVTWQIITGAGRVSAQLRIEQEGLFVIQKVEQLLRSAEVMTPREGTSSVLVVRNTLGGEYVYTTVRHNVASSSVELQRKTGSMFIPLTTNAVAVSTLSFSFIPKEDIVPARLYVTSTINNVVFEMNYLLENI